ncbi:hypothetical protein K431DRAFT_285664 [Polychaeton citri CBS 116435]|uniref:NAD(P)-binding domain-containing protein n=1 Tax=Polychaeton citri CBS 116435 TaxID=1314669 RepID=A0A9P4Q6R6_9PEZI|nr:hypothetical protein K431DRAFT_285664 [Polychaeton citri CBS 116435]
MKVVLTGSTGFVGNEVLEQCIQHSYITHVYCVTRHQIDFKYAKHPKVTQIIHESFDSWPDHILNKLSSAGVEGCIWCLGGTGAKFKDKDEAQRVGIHYPIVAGEAFSNFLAPNLSPSNQTGPRSNWRRFPFRFIFLSCWGAEENQFRSLWVWGALRKTKGAAEKGLFDVADHSQEIEGKKCFEVVALRPGTVLAGGDAISTIMREGVSTSIAVNRLARAAIRTALEGSSNGTRVLENKECLGDDWAQVNSFTI